MQLPDLTEGRLIKRYMRFLADVEFADGTRVTVHCPNPGSMMGLKDPGSRVWVSRSDNPKRKLPHTLELIEADGGLVGINTNLPNAIVAEGIERMLITELAGYGQLRREVKYGTNSRVDILLTEEGRPDCYVEVKNVHLMRETGLAEFPDSVTRRGTRHLGELADMVEAGHRAVMVYPIQRMDCDRFKLADDIDPDYAEAFRAARSRGVEFLAYACSISTSGIEIAQPIAILD